MDDPNITMEEYIRVEEEKAHRHGKVFNGETAKYCKIWYDEDVHDLRSVEIEFPAIVFNNNVTSNETLSCEPTVSSLNDEIDFRISFDESDDEITPVMYEYTALLCKLMVKRQSVEVNATYDIVTGLPKLKFVKDHLCSSCKFRKVKRKSFKTKMTASSKRRLQILHMDLCGPMRVESFNGKKYVLVIVDDYSRYTWTHFLRSKDETPKVLIDFLKLVQRGLHAQVRTVRTDKGTKFLN
ncbi:retrovirus-related pol polyprotein from transposon TNT 1-94 [Tanacetum coccineum]